jgi:hypothetical protein
LIWKQSIGQQFEVHLQAHCVRELGTNGSQLRKLLVGTNLLEWIGNEVICSVGEQRIDMLVVIADGANEKKICMPIELKSVCTTSYITVQLERYVKWLEQYFLPNNPCSMIQPVVLGLEHPSKSVPEYIALLSAFNTFDKQHSTNCLPIKYIEFTVSKSLNFSRIR